MARSMRWWTASPASTRWTNWRACLSRPREPRGCRMNTMRDPRDEARRPVPSAPGNPIARGELADAELGAGDGASGEAAARRELALAPGHPEALARLGREQWLRGQSRAAADSLGQAARAASRLSGIALWLGHEIEDIGEDAAA